jgi:hypothetical protein
MDDFGDDFGSFVSAPPGDDDNGGGIRPRYHRCRPLHRRPQFRPTAAVLATYGLPPSSSSVRTPTSTSMSYLHIHVYVRIHIHSPFQARVVRGFERFGRGRREAARRWMPMAHGLLGGRENERDGERFVGLGRLFGAGPAANGARAGPARRRGGWLARPVRVV